jgi:putative inorganic carbon (HCO3(-)) transporter
MNMLPQIGGPVSALGVVGLLLGRSPIERRLGIALLVAGGGIMSEGFIPKGITLVPALVVAFVFVTVVAILVLALARLPWLLPILVLASVPLRFPVRIGGSFYNSFALLHAVVTAATLILIWKIFHRDRRSRELGPIAWPLAAFIAWSAFSLIWSIDIRRGSTDLDAVLLPFTLLAVALARVPWSRRLLLALLAQLVVMALGFAVVGVYQYETRDIFWNPKVINSNAYAPFFRVNSVFWDPSIYGRFLVLAILACLVVVVTRVGSPWAGAATAAIVALWIGLALSFSQSSFTALIAGVAAASLVAWRKRAAKPLALLLLIIVPVSVVTSQAFAHGSDGVKNDLSSLTSTRSTLVRNGIRVAADHPIIGVGNGGFRRAYADLAGLSRRHLRKATSHTTPVTVAAEEGVIGLLLFLWLLTASFLATFRRAGPSFSGRVELVCALGLTAIAVHSLFYTNFFEDPMMWGFLALAAGAPLLAEPRPLMLAEEMDAPVASPVGPTA